MGSRMLTVGIGLVLATAASAGERTTRENLILAYEEDVNEHARYLAYAEQAERERYLQAARLFRATAEAERVRAERHAQALRRLGAEPRAKTKSAVIGNTRVNLSRTLLHELPEHTQGYLLWSEQAGREGNAEAAQGFMIARAAHETLVSLYREALGNLEATRDAREELHVCRVCGHIARGRAPARCPVSLSTAEAFARVD